ncbi:MAG: hypothetical protein JSS30_06295 [Verrucomicrobia bacterium]|nr:hypothetical protein [Verrucomicrobiota bacterium]
MKKLLLFLFVSLRIWAEFIEYEEFYDFEEFSSIEPPVEEVVLEHPVDEERESNITQFLRSEMIAEQANKAALIDWVRSFSEREYQLLATDEGYFFVPPNETLDYPTHIHLLLSPHLQKGGTVVDYGAGSGIWTVALSDLVGREGKVVAFEPRLKHFIEMFWNLSLNHIHNAQLYCILLDEKEKTLDSLELENVALIRINADGKETDFLNGAARTIQEQKPVLIVRMLGGIPFGWADRFIRDEYQRRLKAIEALGYTTEQITSGEFLALPVSARTLSMNSE